MLTSAEAGLGVRWGRGCHSPTAKSKQPGQSLQAPEEEEEERGEKNCNRCTLALLGLQNLQKRLALSSVFSTSTSRDISE